MIYNLCQYLRTEFTTEEIFVNQWGSVFPNTIVPDRAVLLTETGGLPDIQMLGKEPTIQILTRDTDSVKARSLSYLIYNKLHRRFGLKLPSITVGSESFGELETSQITALVIPQCLGQDDNGRVEWSTNYHIIY